MRLLLVEDNARLQYLAGEALRDAGYSLDVVAGVAEGLAATAAVDYDLLIVDLGLPDGDGLDLIRDLRAARLAAPILVITARTTVQDRVAGLDRGADDYIGKPFNHAELLARVRALLRRSDRYLGPELRIGLLGLDAGSGDFSVGDQPLRLRPRERQLLEILMRRGGSVVPKGALEDALSEFGREISPNAIELLISRLRKALDTAAARVQLETIRGLGYLLREAK